MKQLLYVAKWFDSTQKKLGGILAVVGVVSGALYGITNNLAYTIVASPFLIVAILSIPVAFGWITKKVEENDPQLGKVPKYRTVEVFSESGKQRAKGVGIVGLLGFAVISFFWWKPLSKSNPNKCRNTQEAAYLIYIADFYEQKIEGGDDFALRLSSAFDGQLLKAKQLDRFIEPKTDIKLDTLPQVRQYCDFKGAVINGKKVKKQLYIEIHFLLDNILQLDFPNLLVKVPLTNKVDLKNLSEYETKSVFCLTWSRVLIEKKQYDEALRSLRDCNLDQINNKSVLYWNYYLQGYCLFFLEKYEEAKKCFLKSLASGYDSNQERLISLSMNDFILKLESNSLNNEDEVQEELKKLIDQPEQDLSTFADKMVSNTQPEIGNYKLDENEKTLIEDNNTKTNISQWNSNYPPTLRNRIINLSEEINQALGENQQNLPSRFIDSITLLIQNTTIENGNRYGIGRGELISFIVNKALNFKILDSIYIRSDFESSDLSEKQLQGAYLKNINLKSSNFKKSNLKKANLCGAKISNSNLSNANLIEANLQNADLAGSYLVGADLTNADLSKARLFSSYLRNSNFYCSNLTGADLTGASLVKTNLTGADLTGASLVGADLTKGYLMGTNFTKVNLMEANLSRAYLMEANLTEANLTEANLTEAKLKGAKLKGADLFDTNLMRADLTGVNLTEADLMGADLTGANLSDANLTGANLAGANLTGVNFIGADLRAAKVTHIKIKSVKNLNFLNAKVTSEDFFKKLEINTKTYEHLTQSYYFEKIKEKSKYVLVSNEVVNDITTYYIIKPKFTNSKKTTQ
ncbi:MAG: pentapeptide repeat-containing protein [Aureispira sp.]